MPLYMLIYTALMVRAIMQENIIYILLLLVFGLLSILFVFLKKKFAIKKVKNQIYKVLEDETLEVEPFININKAPWYIINQIPKVSSAVAKKIVWNKFHTGLYVSIDDFLKRNSYFDERTVQLLEKIIKFK